MKVEYILENGSYRPRIVDVNSSNTQLLNCFLEDAENSLPIYLGLIDKAQNGEEITGSSSNQVGVDFYPDKVTIEHLWSDDENGEPLYTEIPLKQAKQLLQSLKSAKDNLRI
ncbi:MAG: hypothetical protein ACR2F2_05440 [Pyrinomonadaceae bacterium]